MMSRSVGPRVMVVLLFAALASTPRVVRAERIDCAVAPTLEELVRCVKAHMPGKHSQGFLVPTPGEQVDWRSVVWAMLNGSCDNIILPASLAGAYTLSKFIDGDTAAEHCVLLETVDADGDGKVDRGWGTFIANPRAARELVLLAPHPVSDVRTHLQSVEVYKGTGARCVLIGGTHRSANARSGACGRSRVSDPTHSVETMFQPTVSEAMDFYDQVEREYVVLQFHGMADTTCAGVDVHLSNGDPETLAGERVGELQARLSTLEPGWTVTTPETTTISCALHGSSNVQVRLLSGVPYDDVCDVATEGPTPQFVHIEQKRGPRRESEVWIAAIRDTWPRWRAPKPPVTPMVAAPTEEPAPFAVEPAAAMFVPVGAEVAPFGPVAAEAAQPASVAAEAILPELVAAEPVPGRLRPAEDEIALPAASRDELPVTTVADRAEVAPVAPTVIDEPADSVGPAAEVPGADLPTSPSDQQ